MGTIEVLALTDSGQDSGRDDPPGTDSPDAADGRYDVVIVPLTAAQGLSRLSGAVRRCRVEGLVVVLGQQTAGDANADHTLSVVLEHLAEATRRSVVEPRPVHRIDPPPPGPFRQ